MQRADIQDQQGDIEGRLAILAEVYSILISGPPESSARMAATREELVKKLTRVRNAFERLQEQYDPDWKGYETKLFMFYDDLLDKAKEFDSAEGEVPQRYTVEDFFRLNLTGYSDIVGLWDMLNNVSWTDRRELVRSLEDIRRKVSAVPDGQNLTCERVALLALLNIWLRQIGRVEVPPPTVECETTILPAQYECILRLRIKSSNVSEYDLEVISPSEEIKVLDQPASVKIGPAGMERVRCKIESEVDGEQDLVLVLSSQELEETCKQGLKVEFYDLEFVKPSNPYPAFGPANPFSFPSRRSLGQKVAETIQNFIRGNTGDFLVVEIRGELCSGKTILIEEICRTFGPTTNLSPDRGVAECKHELQKCLRSDSSVVPLVRCGLAHRFPNRQAIFPSLFEAAQDAGATKAVFLCELPKTEPAWSGRGKCRSFEVKPLTEEDIKSLIEQVGCVGGGPGDTEIRKRFSGNSPFLHFDAEVVDRILDLAAGYPKLAVQVCDKIVERCGDQKCVYVRAEMAEAAIKQICRSVERELSQSIYSVIIGEGRACADERQSVVCALAKSAEDPYNTVPLLELTEYLRGYDIKFDPLRVIRDLEKHNVVVEEDCQEYLFRNPLYFEIAREFCPATAEGTRA